MVEICTDYVEAVEGYIAPNRTPEACTVNRNHADAVLEDIDREAASAAVLDVVVLRFQVSGAVNLSVSSVEASYFLAVGIHQDGLADVLLVEVEDGVVVSLLLELGCSENLADGLSLLVGYLHRLQRLGDESKDSCYQYTNYRCVNYGVNVAVSIHGFRVLCFA